jgi:hypothetical protein
MNLIKVTKHVLSPGCVHPGAAGNNERVDFSPLNSGGQKHIPRGCRQLVDLALNHVLNGGRIEIAQLLLRVAEMPHTVALDETVPLTQFLDSSTMKNGFLPSVHAGTPPVPAEGVSEEPTFRYASTSVSSVVSGFTDATLDSCRIGTKG